MQAKADGYLKKELKKDEKANVKDSLSKSESAKGKPKGVKIMPDKGVEGKEKVVKESVEEGLKSYQNFMATSLEEIKKVQVSFESLKHDVEDLDLKKIDKLDARKLIDGKVEVRELQENLDRVCKELVKMNLAKFEEIRELVNRKEKELILLIDSKPGVHEVNSLILDQNLASVRKSYFNEAQEDRYMRSNELKDSYNNQYLDLFNSKHH